MAKYIETTLEFDSDYFDLKKYREQNPGNIVKAVINGQHNLIIVILVPNESS